jgi:hypothetical protein
MDRSATSSEVTDGRHQPPPHILLRVLSLFSIALSEAQLSKMAPQTNAFDGRDGPLPTK